MKKQQDNIYNSQNDIFLFDNLNSEGYFESGQPTSEYFNRKITITENEEYKTDNKQYKYFIKLGGGKIGGIDKDGNGLTFCSHPRKLTLIKENNKYKLIFGEGYNQVKIKENYDTEDDYMKEDGFESDEEGKLKKIYSYAGEL